jgi:hypothetical protein
MQQQQQQQRVVLLLLGMRMLWHCFSGRDGLPACQ